MDPEELRAVQLAIWARSKPEVERRAATVEHAVVGLLEGHLPDPQRAAALRAAHKLAGAAGTFGFPSVSQAAHDLEDLLTTPVLDPPGAARAAHLAEQLRAALDSDEPPPACAPATGPTLILATKRRAMARHLTNAARSRGMHIEVAGDLDAAAERLTRGGADAVLVVTDTPGLPPSVVEGLRAVADADPSCMLVLAGTELGTSERLDAAAAGVHEFVEAKVSARALLEAVATGLRRTRRQVATVLVVDDDPLLLAAVSALLEPTEMRPVTLADPMQLWEVLAAESPDLLVLDVDMPGADGLALCRLLRGDDRWRQLPLVFLSAKSPERVAQLYAAGADDFVAKPIGPQLVSRLRSRLERARLDRRRAETDAWTGLTNARRLQDAWARLGCTPDDRAVSLALLDLDGLWNLNDLDGHEAQGLVLQHVAAAVRTGTNDEDVVAHLTGGQFGVLVHRPPARAATLLEEALQGLRRGPGVTLGNGETLNVSASGGVVPVRPGERFADAYRAAQAVATRAKALGGDRILAASTAEAEDGRHPLPPTNRVDVVVVEDDEAVAALLRHAVESSGFSCLVIRDGQEALDRLAGPLPPVVARAVLLDVDLPSRNGIEVLRSLRTAGVLRTTAVTMVTGRSTEDDITEALAEGAIDHIAKPFSIPVLAHKLRYRVADRR